MSYSNTQKITPIEMLLELDDLERGNFNGGQLHQQPNRGQEYDNTSTYPGAAMLPPGMLKGLVNIFVVIT